MQWKKNSWLTKKDFVNATGTQHRQLWRINLNFVNENTAVYLRKPSESKKFSSDADKQVIYI
jgi:hypothetical protein